MSETKNIYWTDCKIKLSDLKPWSDNPRMSTKAQAKRILASFEKFGQVQPVAIGPGDEVYDGHQRLSALFTIYGGDYAIDARRASRALSDNERRELVLALHNATGGWNWDTLSGWNADGLQEWGFDGDTLKQWNNDANNLKELLKSETPADDAEPQIDRAEELREKWGVSLGDMWQLGEHRIICGDCTAREVVERVMCGEKASEVVTDPPYGVEYADKNAFLNAISRGNRIQERIEGDHGTKEEMQALWLNAFLMCYEFMLPGACFYCSMPQGGDQMMMMMMMMMKAGIEPRHELIWVKNNHVLGRVDYAYKHEPILYAWKEGGHKFYGDFQTSVITIDKPQKSDMHPTTKPVELFARLIENSSQKGEIVYDPFSGSGTTIAACQNLGRKCRAIEISPAYAAVAIERFAQAFHGIEIRLCESYGTP